MSVMSMPLPRSARALRLEFKRNAVPYVLPLLAAVFYFDTLRTADGFAPIWTLRASVIPDHMLFEFSAFAGGLAAWAGSREGRRRTTDLVASTPRAPWARRSIALAGTLCWLLLAFLAGVAALYIQTAVHATWGGPPLWPVLVGAAGVTVVEFVEYFALLKDMPPRQVPRAVAAAVEQVGLAGKARSRLRTLSGGMLRRAGIAQAIVNDPELLLLDEPTAGLDPEQRVQFRALLRSLGESATVIVSTHLVEDVGAACSEVALMSSGKIVFRGTPDELTARGAGHGVGDAPLERGYSAVLSAARS